MSFSDVEDVLQMHLPNSARQHEGHWYGYDGTAVGRAVRDAGWKATRVNLMDETLVLVRQI